MIDEDNDEAVDQSPIAAGTESAIVFALQNSGLSNNALAAFVRWHQLETWLRQLAYVELRSKYGKLWEAELEKRSIERMDKDRAYPYMASPDLENPLAYLDASKLFDVIEAEWSLFDPVLIDRDIWTGRRAELVKIRHRIGHLRRPHEDDVRRLEQTLRDLEKGAFAAIASYNRAVTFDALSEESNSVVSGWVKEEHEDAKRLIYHAAENKNIHFSIELTRRPWVGAASSSAGAGRAGYLWQVQFHLPDRYVRLHQLWRDNQFRQRALGSILYFHYHDHSHVGFTFPAVDDQDAIADAIGDVFDAVLTNSSVLSNDGPFQFASIPVRTGGNTSSDFRIVLHSPWNVVDESTVPITIFGAQAIC